MTTLSLANPFLTAATTLELSHYTQTECFANSAFHTAQLRTISTNSLAMMFVLAHLVGHCPYNHFPMKKLPHPQEPDASVWIRISGTEGVEMPCRRLSPFQVSINT